MTPEEFKQKLDQLDKELFKIRLQERDKRSEIHNLKREFCESLCEKYAEYQGKKVKITFSYVDSWSRKTEYKHVVGYLRGFSYGFSYSVGGEIYPVVSKVNKDGRESKNKYSVGDILSWNKICDIQEVL